MKIKLQNITNRGASFVLLAALFLLWHVVSVTGLVQAFMLPSPGQVWNAFVSELPVLMEHSLITLSEAFCGLFIAIVAGMIIASLMDRSKFLYRAIYPILTITQTIPTVAIAPLLVLWMGYGLAPKIVLVILVCFFPITIGMLDGLRSVDKDAIGLLESMGAGKLQIFWHMKLPCALPGLFSGLKIAIAYAIVGAVIAEWLGGTGGLGVYMTRVRKTYAFDKMFAVIFWISILSLIMMALAKLVEKALTPWKRLKQEE